MTVATGLALLSGAGTAVAAETGRLPTGVQQHAHRLFSALGVPAPRTGSTPSAPAGSPTPTPTPTATPAPIPTPPTPAASVPAAVRSGWCTAWQAAARGGKPMHGRARRDLIAAAGGETNVARYCAFATASASPTGSPASSRKPGNVASSHRAKPSHPTPHATTPSHPGAHR